MVLKAMTSSSTDNAWLRSLLQIRISTSKKDFVSTTRVVSLEITHVLLPLCIRLCFPQTQATALSFPSSNQEEVLDLNQALWTEYVILRMAQNTAHKYDTHIIGLNKVVESRNSSQNVDSDTTL